MEVWELTANELDGQKGATVMDRIIRPSFLFALFLGCVFGATVMAVLFTIPQ